MTRRLVATYADGPPLSDLAVVSEALENAIINGFDVRRADAHQIAVDLGTYEQRLEGRDDLEPVVALWMVGQSVLYEQPLMCRPCELSRHELCARYIKMVEARTNYGSCQCEGNGHVPGWGLAANVYMRLNPHKAKDTYWTTAARSKHPSRIRRCGVCGNTMVAKPGERFGRCVYH